MKKKFAKVKQEANRLVVQLKPARSRSDPPIPHEPGPSAPELSTGTPDYADPKAPQTSLGTTGSVVHEFLAAAREGADLCLPLKAALVGAVKVFEICEASGYVYFAFINGSDHHVPVHRRCSRSVPTPEEQTGASRRRHWCTQSAQSQGSKPNAASRRYCQVRAGFGLEYIMTELLMEYESSFSELTACIEAKQARSTVRRVLESHTDVAEIKYLLIEVSGRLKAFVVCVVWLIWSGLVLICLLV